MTSKRYNLTCAPVEDSDQSAHVRSLIRVFDGPTLVSQGSNKSSCVKLRLWSDCLDVQTGLNIRCSHMSICISCCIPALTGLQIRECSQKWVFLFLNQNICCWYSKEPSRWDGSFEHPKQMFRLIDKKIFTFYAPSFCLSGDVFNKSWHEPTISLVLIKLYQSQTKQLKL